VDDEEEIDDSADGLVDDPDEEVVDEFIIIDEVLFIPIMFVVDEDDWSGFCIQSK